MPGYHEWRGTRSDKQPRSVRRRDGKHLWAAALREPPHHTQDENEAGSLTLITPEAVDDACKVHDRIPVFLPAPIGELFTRASSEDAMRILRWAEIPLFV